MKNNLGSRLILGVVLGLFLASAALAEEQILVKKDGKTITGEITKEGDNYNVKTRTGDVVVPVKDVERIDQTPKAIYLKKLAELKPDDPSITEKRYKLAQEAKEHGLLPEALEQLNILDKSKWGGDPWYQKIGPKLKDEVERSLNSGTSAQTPGDTQQPKETAPKPANNEEAKNHDLDKELLTLQQISRIRLEELDSEKDKNVAVVFKPGTLANFMQKLQGRDDYDQKKFQAMKPFDQLIFLLGAFGGKDKEDVKDAVTINFDPKFMVDFKTNIWPLIRNNCASANCHGGASGVGGFYLYDGGGAMVERQLYTNFIILRGYNRGARMIDGQQPEKSLLLCYSLPRDKTESKHPFANQAQVNASNAGPIEISYLCDGKDSDKYKKISAWISTLKPLIRVDYNVGDWKPWGMEPNFFRLKEAKESILPPRQVESQPASASTPQ